MLLSFFLFLFKVLSLVVGFAPFLLYCVVKSFQVVVFVL
jgi:hypothetical protein